METTLKEQVTQSFSKVAEHLTAAAQQVRRFGPSGEPSAQELEKLALLVASGKFQGPGAMQC